MKLSNQELDEILSKGRLIMAEPYHDNQSYAKRGYILTRCEICGLEAHYTLDYIMKTGATEPVCRVHHWRKWFAAQREASESFNKMMQESGLSWLFNRDDPAITDEEASSIVAKDGFELVALLRGDRPGEELYQVRCQSCGRVSVLRRSDLARCGCVGGKNNGAVTVPPKHTGRKRSSSSLLCESGAECVDWWDHDKNSERDFETVRPRGRSTFWWKCPKCGYSFEEFVYRMTNYCSCPRCLERERSLRQEEQERYKSIPITSVPSLHEAWDDIRDPSKVMVVPNDNSDEPSYTQLPNGAVLRSGVYRFRCKRGHHINIQPYQFMKNGCPYCKAQDSRKTNEALHINLRVESPELVEEWDYARNGKQLTPEKVRLESKRKVWWKCLRCGHEWQLPVYQRNRGYGQACPECGKVINSFAWQYPGLASEWSSNNPISPWNIYPGTSLRFVPEWICTRNPTHVWQAGIAGRTKGGQCPVCKDSGKSRVSVRYFEEIKKSFRSIRLEVPLYDNGFSHNPWSVDMLAYVNEEKVVIEYDGAYWHSEKIDTDLRKTSELLSAGYIVIRLREDDLSSLDISNDKYAELWVSSQNPNPKATAQKICALLSDENHTSLMAKH